jgi:hypothetical protein
VRCRQAHRKTGRGFKRILGSGNAIFDFKDTDRTEIGPPDGISTGRQIEYATVEEQKAQRRALSTGGQQVVAPHRLQQKR